VSTLARPSNEQLHRPRLLANPSYRDQLTERSHRTHTTLLHHIIPQPHLTTHSLINKWSDNHHHVDSNASNALHSLSFSFGVEDLIPGRGSDTKHYKILKHYAPEQHSFRGDGGVEWRSLLLKAGQQWIGGSLACCDRH
jgi:hypothetical protein